MKKTDFIQMDTKKALIKMVIPMIVIMFLDIAYNLVDGFWVGNLLGKIDYAALTNSTPILLFLVAISLGTTGGIAIVVSQALGAKDKDKTESVIATGFIILIIMSIVIIFFLEIFLNQILRIINVPEETFRLASEYLRIYILGYLPIFIYLFFMTILRSLGDLKFQIAPMILSIILNIMLDPLFIEKMGFKGVAYATIIAQTLAMGLLIIYTVKGKRFSVKFRKINMNVGKEIVRKMIPSIGQECLPAISTLFFTAFISSFGIVALDAYGIIGGIERFLLYPAMSMNMVLTIIIGQCYGAKRGDRIRDYLKCAIKYGGIILVILTVIMIVFSKDITYIFIKGNSISKIVREYFLIVGIGYLFNYISNCFLGFLNGIGKPAKGLIIKIVYYIVIRIPMAYIFSKYLNLGINGIWLAILISYTVSCGLSGLFSKKHLIINLK